MGHRFTRKIADRANAWESDPSQDWKCRQPPQRWTKRSTRDQLINVPATNADGRGIWRGVEQKRVESAYRLIGQVVVISHNVYYV